MSELLSDQFIGLLACPDCACDLIAANDQLRCTNCGRTYPVRNGIPCLYPSSLDGGHLDEEEQLADMMMKHKHTKKSQFNSVQWKTSKNEFWKVVQDNVDGNNKIFINIGCGYDSNFMEHEKNGHIFINFDLIFKMLNSLREDNGAKSCVAGDINKLPFKKESFDYVISIDVIHHESSHVESLIKSFADLLKPGGVMFLEDPNAWGMFQAPKSIFLPKPLYQAARSAYHRIRQSSHRPADYEFPTNIWKVKNLIKNLNFTDPVVYPIISYPTIGPTAYQIYKLFSGIQYIRKYHNYHYMISAVKK